MRKGGVAPSFASAFEVKGFYQGLQATAGITGFCLSRLFSRSRLIMLVTFKTDAYADIIMFGDIARRLLKMMGHSGTIPGAILADDVPSALDRLKRAIDSEKSAENPPPQSEGEEDEQPAVKLSYRALPLIELLTAAAKKKRDVMWEKM